MRTRPCWSDDALEMFRHELRRFLKRSWRRKRLDGVQLEWWTATHGSHWAPSGRFLGGFGFAQLVELLPKERLALAIQAVSATERALEITIGFVDARAQTTYGGTNEVMKILISQVL